MVDTRPDPELQAELATLALAGLDRILTALPPSTTIEAAGIGAILRLIVQAGGTG